MKLDRWREKVVEDDNGCLIWQGTMMSDGYGWVRTGPGRRGTRAHRAVYIHERGPVPDDLVMDHLCRNKRCVNPDHLEPVTDRVNILRGVSPSALNARKTHCKQGHAYTDETTHVRFRRDGRTERVCLICEAVRRQTPRTPEARAARFAALRAETAAPGSGASRARPRPGHPH